MATKATKKKPGSKTAKKAGSKRTGARGNKRAAKKSAKTKSSPGIISKVKKLAGKVLAGAAAGAMGAVEGVAAAGSKATGIGKPAKATSKRQKPIRKSKGM